MKEVLELIKLNSDTGTVGGLNELSLVDVIRSQRRVLRQAAKYSGRSKARLPCLSHASPSVITASNSTSQTASTRQCRVRTRTGWPVEGDFIRTKEECAGTGGIGEPRAISTANSQPAHPATPGNLFEVSSEVGRRALLQNHPAIRGIRVAVLRRRHRC